MESPIPKFLIKPLGVFLEVCPQNNLTNNKAKL